MPPVLDPKRSKVDGLAFLGLSLSRKGPRGHPESATHQQAFDLDLVQDRDYEYLFSTNDDGWLVGGGEPGPPHSYKLAAKDSAHVEIMRIGTFQPSWGGVDQHDIVRALREGKILIPEITVVPTAVVANGDKPPELEIRFDMVPPIPNFEDANAALPLNWQLRFIHNQLFNYFKFPSRFCPGAFHSTILRKAEFRSPSARQAYFSRCGEVVEQWMERGKQPLLPAKVDNKIEVVKCARREPKSEKKIVEDTTDEHLSDYYRSGLWLFTDRNTITHQFLPNFLPPYDTPLKKKLILEVLKEEWDEQQLSWRSLTNKYNRKTTAPPATNKAVMKSDKLVAAPPSESRAIKPMTGIFDPRDELGFTAFMSNIGAEVAALAVETCGPSEPGKQEIEAIIKVHANELVRDSMGEEKSSKDPRIPPVVVQGTKSKK